MIKREKITLIIALALLAAVLFLADKSGKERFKLYKKIRELYNEFDKNYYE